MSTAENKAVFLSYASQDAEAARRIADALRAAGVEVWFDQSELVGGDSWDAKIRGQIGSCALFVPIISTATQARLEGYFRLEWKLAAQRTHTMADEKTFLLPIVIDATRDVEAKVPAEFKAVQWTKLPGGETPPAFTARVMKLLSGEQGAGSRELMSVAPAPPVRSSPSKWWWALPIFGVTMALLLLLKEKEPARLEAPVRSVSPSAAATTPAQELVAKAQAIVDQGDELNRETYVLAEELLAKAEQLDVTEASAWILHAQISAAWIAYALDDSTTRREALRVQANRAVQLAPASLAAQLVECEALIAFGQNAPGIVARLQALAAKHPENWRVFDLLSEGFRVEGKFTEGLAANERALQLAPDNFLVKGNRLSLLSRTGDWVAAEKELAVMMQGRTSARILAFDVLLKLVWRGDPAGAVAAVQGWPAWFLLEDRGVVHAVYAALWNRNPALALQFVQKYPRDYVRDYMFTGPTAVLSAWANEQAGNLETARADWRVVQQVAERELQARPNETYALHWKAWALARLGDTVSAAPILRQLMEGNSSMRNMARVLGRFGALALTMGRGDLALAQIAKEPRVATQSILRLNPVFDRLREDPRFQSLIESAPGPQESKQVGAAASAANDKSVAVLAFTNLSDDKANEYFSDGISEELLNVLAKVPGLTVRGRSSGFYFKGKQVKSAEIGQQLDVSYLVQGSVRRAGDRVRISAQLIRAATDDVVWSSGSLDRDLKDIFAVQDEIAGLIAKNLSLKMGVAARAPHQVNPEALTALLEGRHFWALRTMEGFARAGELFNRAVALDPDWAPAHAALASLLTIEASYRKGGGDSVSEQYALAAREAKRAIELDPTLGEPHAALGKIAMEDRRFAEAEEESRRALELEPNNALVVDWHGDLMVTRGRLDLAIAAYRRALELEPLSPYILWDLAWELMHVRRYGEALPLIERAMALTPTGAGRLSLRRARLLLELGRKAEAEAALRVYLESPRTGSDPQIANEAVWCLRALGSPADRERRTAELLRQYPDSFASGVILLMLGREEEAYPLLERFPTIFWQQLYWEPVFDPVRDTPRFHKLLEKLGCTAEYKVARETLARMLKEQEAKK